MLCRQAYYIENSLKQGIPCWSSSQGSALSLPWAPVPSLVRELISRKLDGVAKKKKKKTTVVSPQSREFWTAGGRLEGGNAALKALGPCKMPAVEL